MREVSRFIRECWCLGYLSILIYTTATRIAGWWDRHHGWAGPAHSAGPFYHCATWAPEVCLLAAKQPWASRRYWFVAYSSYIKQLSGAVSASLPPLCKVDHLGDKWFVEWISARVRTTNQQRAREWLSCQRNSISLRVFMLVVVVSSGYSSQRQRDLFKRNPSERKRDWPIIDLFAMRDVM